MRMYIKSIEERAWQRVLDIWSPPRIVDTDGDNRVKPESAWSNDEIQASNFNSKALNAIFTSVDVNMFSLITNCISTKDAWDILQKHCEGSERVRRTKLRMLTSKFESLRMKDNETIVEYDRRLCDNANEVFSLGDPMSNERLVSKVLRSLPEHFNIKICAIDESKDTSTLNLEDLIGLLRTFEMNLDLQKRDKGKAVALQISDDSFDDLIRELNESDFCEDSILFITKKFGDYLKKIRDKKNIVQTPKPPFFVFEKNKRHALSQGKFRPRSELMARPDLNRLDSVQCRECFGFGHYTNECANMLRKNKGMGKCWLQVNPHGVAFATPGRNTTSKTMCLNAKSHSDSRDHQIQDTDSDELTFESVQDMYEELYEDLIKINKINLILSKDNTDLKECVSRLEVVLSKKDLEICRVKDDLEKALKTLGKFNSSSTKLDSMLMMGNNSRAGLGYVKSIYEHGETSNSGAQSTAFIRERKVDPIPSKIDPEVKTLPIKILKPK
ncbi:uncharacterized protein LOC142541862 [Primulina tabacum]|uniref:uncharacterized protein LOC142541862 n=1 Tax=Primulina tabacum TaxID=48773 RepID=UPI003F5AA5D7